MQGRQSKVNFRKLVQDLADMYHDATFDVVLAELIANALDAKASEISIDWDDAERVLVVTDNGSGMDEYAFEQYHDFAAELKTRGHGIGFAGVGAKISFNIASHVLTESRSGSLVHASDWRWQDDTLQWRPVQCKHLKNDGTRVEVHFIPSLAPSYVDADYLVNVLRHHYLPLFITEFTNAYSAAGLYPTPPQFTINDSALPQQPLSDVTELSQSVAFTVKAGRDDVGLGAIGVSPHDHPVGEDAYGVLLCTYGKVIKPELFGLSTGTLGTRLFGIVEIPGLIQYMTANKSDLKGGPGRSQGLRRLLDPVREELRKFLAAQGVAVVEQRRNQLSARLERELSKIVPRLQELQDFDGLLRKSRALRKTFDGNILTSKTTVKHASQAPVTAEGGDPTSDSSNGNSRQPDKEGTTRARRQRSRRNQGPRVAFEEHLGRNETAWVDSDTIVINSGHTAYRQRINQDQARLTYCMFAIGVALDKADLVPSDGSVSYVDKFISAWGQS